jgi:hypothetical protein
MANQRGLAHPTWPIHQQISEAGRFPDRLQELGLDLIEERVPSGKRFELIEASLGLKG